MANKIFGGLSKIYLFFVFLFLYVPIFVIIIYSFNVSKSNSVWAGFTPDWYSKLLTDENVIDALKNSLSIAFFSTMLSCIIGTLGAVGMKKYKFRGKGLIDTLLYVPIVIPEIILGIALLMCFTYVNIPLGMATLVMSHTTFCIPFVFINVKTRLAGFDTALEEAAMDLGASKLTVFRTVTLPLILPGILSGGMLAFALSLDDIIINFFVSGPESTTLPIKIFSMLRFGLSPEINALFALMLSVTLIAFIGSQKIRIKKS